MTRYLCSLLLLSSLTPFMFGCGEEAPLHEEFDETELIDPAEESANDKQMKKELQ